MLICHWVGRLVGRLRPADPSEILIGTVMSISLLLSGLIAESTWRVIVASYSPRGPGTLNLLLPASLPSNHISERPMFHAVQDIDFAV